MKEQIKFMKVPTKALFSAFLCIIAVGLIACSHAAFCTTNCGPGGNGPFSIGGTVTGLSGTGLTLQNGTDTLVITGNSAFTFKTLVASGGSYNVVVTQPPTAPSQTCTVSNASGKAAANVTNVTVTCTTGTVAIGVTVAGLSGTGLVLQNGTDFLTITGSNTTAQFKNAVPYGTPYNVVVSTQPSSPAQTCTVTGGQGTATQGVAVNVQVTCSLGTLSVSVAVSGFAGGTGFVLQNNGVDNLSITANKTYTFATLIPVNGKYAVTILMQPAGPNQLCTVPNGTGTATANVTNISVVCPAVFHPIDVNVVGVLGISGKMVLTDNAANDLHTPKNGAYTFPPVAHGSNYNVDIIVAPGTQPEPCYRWGWSGIALSTPVNPIPLIDCGHDDWTWMDGSPQVDQFGKTTKPTVPPAPCPPLDADTPGGNRYSSAWTDLPGNLWLLTGDAFSSATPPPANQPFFVNELWEFTGTNQYTGGCGIKWTLISPINALPARWGAVTWTDPTTGNLWLFGGEDGFPHFQNDLWEYNIGTKTWTQHGGGLDQPGSYGGITPPIVGGRPGGRWAASGRVDASGTFWLFGGIGCDSTPGACSNTLLNDIWKYNTATNTWTWVSGSPTGNQLGSYPGPAPTVPPTVGGFPGARHGSITWFDNSSKSFWMFGGYTNGTNGFNDLWKFDTVASNWTWVSGSQGAVSTKGVYGNQGQADPANVPGARWNSAAWSDIQGNLWLFGGEGFDTTGNGTLGDLWEYTLSATTDPGNPAKIAVGQWTWIRGPKSVSQPGTYGVPPDPSAVWPHVTNNPGTRWGAAYWTTTPAQTGEQEFWMLGGEGFDANGATGLYNVLNDLWRYLPYP
jgi:hypothetical protein